MIFLERRMVIDMLYRHIRQKDKILTSRRVVGFEMDENGVSVECQDGSVHRGSILVGADGIRSTVSRQMSQLSGNSKKGKYVFRAFMVALSMLSIQGHVLSGAPCLFDMMCSDTWKSLNPCRLYVCQVLHDLFFSFGVQVGFDFLNSMRGPEKRIDVRIT